MICNSVNSRNMHLGQYVANLIKPLHTIVIYVSRVVPNLKIPHITTLEL